MTLTLAGAVALYMVDPFAALIFVCLTGFDLYDMTDQPYIIIALIMLGIVRKFMKLGDGK